MATRQVFIDDIDGTEDNVESVQFGLDGVTYAIDLSEQNQVRLREFLQDFVDNGTPLDKDGNPKAKRSLNRKSQARRDAPPVETPAPSELPPFDSKTARAWLRENGHAVPDRGKLRAEVVAPYLQSEDYMVWAAANK